jgi:hypothetical protein
MGKGPEKTVFQRRYTNGHWNGAWKYAQYRCSLGKCKSKPNEIPLQTHQDG